MSYSKQTYQFEAYTSSQPWYAPATEDTVYFRLCNINNICGKFTTVAQGWPSQGKKYNYNYITNQDIGSITKAQIVLDGSDQLCLGHIKVDNIEYDAGVTPICIVDETGGCDTITVNLQNNNWQTHHTIPCEFEAILHDTYEPTKYPTINPTLSPTISPTKSTQIPSLSPTTHTITPTLSPTQPSKSPTMSPTQHPSSNPTLSPFRSANVDDIIKNTDMNKNGSDSVESYDNKSDKFEIGNGSVVQQYLFIIGIIFAVLFCCTKLLFFVMYCYFNKKQEKDKILAIKKASDIHIQQAINEGVASCSNISARYTQSSQMSEMSSIMNINAKFEGNESKLNKDDNTVIPMISPMLMDICASDHDIEDIYDKGVDDIVNRDSVTTRNTMTAGLPRVMVSDSSDDELYGKNEINNDADDMYAI